MPGKSRLSKAYKRYLRERRYWKRVVKQERARGNQNFIETQILAGPRNKDNEPIQPVETNDSDSDPEDIVPPTEKLLKYAETSDDSDVGCVNDEDYGTNQVEDCESSKSEPEDDEKDSRARPVAAVAGARRSDQARKEAQVPRSTQTTRAPEPQPGPSGMQGRNRQSGK